MGHGFLIMFYRLIFITYIMLYYIFFFEETLSKKQGPLRDMPALQTTQEKPAKGGMPKSSMKNVKTTRDEHTF